MEKYTVVELLGEGSYGKVLKCRHKDSGCVVAIKKFRETEEDAGARKVALREIRMLKKLQHPNLVCLLEVFRRKKRFHLVFEYMNCSLLEELEAQGSLEEQLVRKYMYQIIRGVDYCHTHNIIHRDIKPENILISDLGLVKICDFGFARFATISNEPFTDYVATRWYRSPELLVGEVSYGRAVDIWALGCIQMEMLTGDPLFPGNSDIDQLYLITKLLGSLTEGQKMLMCKCGSGKEAGGEDLLYMIKNRLKMDPIYCLRESYPTLDRRTTDFAASCLRLDPDDRPSSEQLLKNCYFRWDMFLNQYIPELQKKIQVELSRRVPVTDLPCPRTLAQEPYSALSVARKPSRFNTEWTINKINAGNMEDTSIYKESEEERKPGERTGTSKSDKPLEPSPLSLRSDLPKKEEMPKIRLDFRRNMLPGTQTYLRPVKGRLHYDKYLSLPCRNVSAERDQAIYLPLIKTVPEKKPAIDKRNVHHLKRKKSAPKEREKSKSQKDAGHAHRCCEDVSPDESAHQSYRFPAFP